MSTRGQIERERVCVGGREERERGNIFHKRHKLSFLPATAAAAPERKKV